MADQSGIQKFIQSQAGTQTTAQGNVPTAVNNGNPNTVYNIPTLQTPTWGTYVPTTTVPPNGGLPSTTFDLVQAPYVPSSPGYVSPFTADPTVAMVLSQMPQAQGNAIINSLLSRMTRPRPQAPVTPSTPGNPITPPGTPPTTPTAPTAPTRPGAVGRPVGPISGPVHDWMTTAPVDPITWSGTNRPVLGLPPLDIADVLHNLGLQANLEISEYFRKRGVAR
jgi:hypothetical protein